MSIVLVEQCCTAELRPVGYCMLLVPQRELVDPSTEGADSGHELFGVRWHQESVTFRVMRGRCFTATHSRGHASIENEPLAVEHGRVALLRNKCLLQALLALPLRPQVRVCGNQVR